MLNTKMHKLCFTILETSMSVYTKHTFAVPVQTLRGNM